jgi:hypothetical protein
LEQIYRLATDISIRVNRFGQIYEPKKLGLRTVERLVYNSGGELLYHQDQDSIYTMVLMLSQQQDFEGGTFYIKNATSKDKSPIKINSTTYGIYISAYLSIYL